MAETIRGINIKLTLDGKDLMNELNEIKSNLKEQQKDLKAINNSLRYDSSNVELWREKQSKLNSILEETKKKLVNQNEQLEKAKKALEVGEISEKEYNTLKRNVTYTEAEVSKLNNELEKTQNQITKLSQIDVTSLSKFGDNMTKYVTAPIIAAVTALTTLSIKSAETADDLNDTAQNLGISITALQEWNYAAKILAVENEQLQKAFIKTNSVLGDLAAGNSNAATQALEKLGITYDDLKGKSNDEGFAIIRDALSKLEDSTLRTSLANDIFGERIASGLTQLLSAEASEIDNLIDECNELGIVTQEQADISGAFNDEIDKVKTSLNALGVEIAVVVLPAFTNLLELVRSSIIPKISEWTNTIANLSSGMKKALVIVVAIVAAIGPAIKIITSVIKVVQGVSVALKAVGASGFFAGQGINAATLGIGALVAILLVALTESEKFQEILHKIGEAFMNLLEPIINIVEVLMDVLIPIFDVVFQVVGELINVLMPLLDAILNPVFEVLRMIGKVLEAFMPLIQVLADIVGKVLSPVLNVLYAILEPILTILSAIIDAITWIVDNTVGWLLDIVDSAINWFTGGSNDVSSSSSSGTTNNTNNTTTNYVTVNTTSSEFDIDSINKALGDDYL